jgi:uncharacterized protein (TIGR02001 family)
MKRVRYGLASAVAMMLTAGLAPVAQSQVELSGNVAIVSDYVFRGISQTSEEPAIQGGIDVGLPYGVYLGTWASSVNFGPGDETALELDVYGGIAPSLSGFDLDLGLLYYGYPGADSDLNFNFLEVVGGVSRTFGQVTTELSGAYSPEFFAESGPALFGQFGASVAVPNAPLTLDGSVGMQTIDDSDAFGLPDYMTWSAGVSVDVLGTGVGASVTGTDLSDDECSDICGTRFVIGLSRAL